MKKTVIGVMAALAVGTTACGGGHSAAYQSGYSWGSNHIQQFSSWNAGRPANLEVANVFCGGYGPQSFPSSSPSYVNQWFAGCDAALTS